MVLTAVAKEKDIVTYHLALEIMADEIEHEEDLESILDDMSGK